MGLTLIAPSVVASMVLSSALCLGKHVLMEGIILLKCAVSTLGKYTELPHWWFPWTIVQKMQEMIKQWIPSSLLES